MTKKLRYLCTLLLMAVAGVSWGQTVTDEMTAADLPATGTTYTDFSDVSFDSDAIYAGNSAKNSTNIQLRSKNSNSGIVTTASGGKIQSVKITVGSGSGTVDVYGSNTAYESAADLYDTDKQGTIIGSVSATGTITVSGDYKYVGIRSRSGALYLSSIEFTWNTSTAETAAAPSFSPAAGIYNGTQNVTISSLTSGATIYYTLDGTDPTTSSAVYNGAITVSKNTTIKAMAVKTGIANSSVASAEYQIVNITGGTANDPYTVEMARQAIDANIGVENVYATGIVSEIVTAYSSQHNNVTYNISDDGSLDAPQLQIYRGTGSNSVSAEDIQVGDKVVVTGNLKKFNTTYEFEQGSTLVSLEKSTTPRIVAEDVTLDYDATTGSIEFEIENPGTVLAFAAEVESGCNWITDLNADANPITFKTTVNNGTADRSATITLHCSGAEDKVVTVTQKHHVQVVVEEDEKTTFLFNTENMWGIPTTKTVDEDEFTADGYTITIAGSEDNGYFYDERNKYLLMGRQGAYLTLPAFNFPVSKIEVVGRSGASSSVVQNIYVGEDAVSTETIGATETNTYEIDADNQAAGTIYTLKVGSNHNTQITEIIVYKGEDVAEEVSIEIGESGYATLYYSDKSLEIPEGVTASIITSVNGTQVETTALDAVISAGTAVILEGEPGTYSFKVTNDIENAEGNMLMGTDAEEETTATTVECYFYKFVNETNGVGFWWGAEDGGAFTNGAHKAYLAVPKSNFEGTAAPAKIFLFGGEEGVSTGINQVEKNTGDAAIYNLNGIRVNKMQKGVYVVNGKKVVIK